MNVVLVERNPAARPAVEGLLRSLGARRVASFGDPEIALRFLLGRLGEVEAVVLNEDDQGARALLRRVRVLPARVAAIGYSGRKLSEGAAAGRAPTAKHLAAAMWRVDPVRSRIPRTRRRRGAAAL